MTFPRSGFSDPMFEQGHMSERDQVEAAKTLLAAKEKLSGCTSYLQRMIPCAYTRAKQIMEHLEAIGFISPADDQGNRRLLSTPN